MDTRFRELQKVAVFVRNAAPEQWEAFLEQFSYMAQRCTNGVLKADQNTILNTQGRAQQAVDLFDALLKCDEVNKPPTQTPAPPT